MKRRTGNGKLPFCEEGSNAVSGEFGELSLDDLTSAEFQVNNLIGMATDFVEDINGEPGFLPVVMSKSVHGDDGFVLAIFGEKEFG